MDTQQLYFVRETKILYPFISGNIGKFSRETDISERKIGEIKNIFEKIIFFLWKVKKIIF